MSRTSAIDAVIRRYEKPSAHLDNDTDHVSRFELIAAGAFDLLDEYQTLRKTEREGRFNDSEVSMRDLYSLRRGTAYDTKAKTDRLGALIGLIAAQKGESAKLSKEDVSAFVEMYDAGKKDGVISRAEFDSAAASVNLSFLERPVLWKLLKSELDGKPVSVDSIYDLFWSYSRMCREKYGTEVI